MLLHKSVFKKSAVIAIHCSCSSYFVRVYVLCMYLYTYTQMPDLSTFIWQSLYILLSIYLEKKCSNADWET